MMISNTSKNKSLPMNIPPMFNGERYIIQKARMQFFLKTSNFNVWDAINYAPFIHTHFINDEVVNKLRDLQTKEEKENVKHSLKSKYRIVSVLSINEYNYVFNYSSTKELCGTLKIIYEDPTKIKRDMMNTLVQKSNIPKGTKENLQIWFTNNVMTLCIFFFLE